ncbi:MAG: hypothetical protein ACRD1V_16115 [Vicinamibacterales bacterium]
MTDSESQLDSATRQAVLRHLRTIEEFEILLLLARDTSRYWSPAAAGADLGVSEDSARTALDALASRNLLDVRIGESVLYRLDPTSSATTRAVERIIVAARTQRTAVLRAIATAGRAVGDFADAFRISKRRRDG